MNDSHSGTYVVVNNILMASVSFYSEIARPQLFADCRRHQLLSAMDYLYSAALHATHTREILNVTIVDSTGGGPDLCLIAKPLS